MLEALGQIPSVQQYVSERR